ncbi:hypothetical protein TPY_1347 [Sulfobacillus acidophilus TPY]|nr:hypothetical protein TPY_1347 [Sulfobacillus acidophilus TPY]
MRISSGIIIPLDNGLLQTYVDARLQGRVFSLHQSTYGGVMQLSYALDGSPFSNLAITLSDLASALCPCYAAYFGSCNAAIGKKTNPPAI